MAISKSFKLAELIRHIEYDSTDDVIKTSKKTEDKNKREVRKQKLLQMYLISILLHMQPTGLQDISLQCLKEQISIQRKSC